MEPNQWKMIHSHTHAHTHTLNTVKLNTKSQMDAGIVFIMKIRPIDMGHMPILGLVLLCVGSMELTIEFTKWQIK